MALGTARYSTSLPYLKAEWLGTLIHLCCNSHLSCVCPFRLLKQKHHRPGGSFFALCFLTEGWLIYRISWFSVIEKQESSMGSPMPPPSDTSSHLLPHPTLLAGLRAPVWVPWVTQQIPAGYLFYMWYCNRWLTNNRTLLLLLLSRFSRVRLCATQRQQPTRLPRPWDSPGKNPGVGCHFLLQCMKVKSESEVTQSFPTLSDPMDCSLPGSSVHGFSRQEYWSGVPLPSPE